MADFRSDNTLGCSPEIIEALRRASDGSLSSYGADPITGKLRERVRELFETDLEIFPLATGTGANCLAIASMSDPWSAVFCHADAHVYRDESGAPEFFTHGAKLVPIAGGDGKLHARDLDAVFDDILSTGRTATPGCLSLTQATEAGTIYTPDEMREICSIAKKHSLGVHVDGARFANAVATLGCSAADITWRAGVDMLVFGATKNGAMGSELLVVFGGAEGELARRIHRSGHRFSKMRFLSAQFEAYLTDDLWLKNARVANGMAKRLADGLRAIPSVEILRPVEANIVFARFKPETLTALHDDGFEFYDWSLFGPGSVRLVTGFSTTEAEIDRFVASATEHSKR
jgi:threonine aldolase